MGTYSQLPQTARTQSTPTAKFEHASLLKGSVARKLTDMQRAKSQDAGTTLKKETGPAYLEAQTRAVGQEKDLIFVFVVVIALAAVAALIGYLIKKSEYRQIERQARTERMQMLKEDADRQLKEIEKKNAS